MPCITLIDSGTEAKTVINRFEIRLQSYADLPITESSNTLEEIITSIMEEKKKKKELLETTDNLTPSTLSTENEFRTQTSELEKE